MTGTALKYFFDTISDHIKYLLAVTLLFEKHCVEIKFNSALYSNVISNVYSSIF